MANKQRQIVQTLLSAEQGEGEGARVRRSIGRRELRSLDPFLMLDEFHVSPPAGFPDHPHRGFETVTYMLSGSFRHEDFCGHIGEINPGDLQWMTAGKGVVHCEIPLTKSAHGLQLWVNLAPKDKMVPPAYQELLSKDIPKVRQNGANVTVIAGESCGITSPVYTRTPTMYLDVSLQPNSTFEQAVPEEYNGFVYTLEGSALFGSDAKSPTEPHNTLVLGPGTHLTIKTTENNSSRFVIVAGKPIGAPVAQHGPFVMNTQEEIMKTMMDFQSGSNGFERAPTWQSQYVKSRGY